MGWSEWKDFGGESKPYLELIRTTTGGASNRSSGVIYNSTSNNYYKNNNSKKIKLTTSRTATTENTSETVYVRVYGSDDDATYTSIQEVTITNSEKITLVDVLNTEGMPYQYIRTLISSACQNTAGQRTNSTVVTMTITPYEE